MTSYRAMSKGDARQLGAHSYVDVETVKHHLMDKYIERTQGKHFLTPLIRVELA
jgi:hypothetical protein